VVHELHELHECEEEAAGKKPVVVEEEDEEEAEEAEEEANRRKGLTMKNEDKIVYRQLSFDVTGCAQRVHRALGPGFPESVYHKALCYELVDAGIPFESQKASEVFYEGKLCGEFRMDIVVDQKIILELKALARLTDDHMAQVISYVKATGHRRAILLNFGVKSLETQRIVR